MSKCYKTCTKDYPNSIEVNNGYFIYEIELDEDTRIRYQQKVDEMNKLYYLEESKPEHRCVEISDTEGGIDKYETTIVKTKSNLLLSQAIFNDEEEMIGIYAYNHAYLFEIRFSYWGTPSVVEHTLRKKD
ncbi:MAG: hypothetical protein IJQ67_03490 [Bacilli bacterium]|nr:hypothetical protein [Bacilli bacterium]